MSEHSSILTGSIESCAGGIIILLLKPPPSAMVRVSLYPKRFYLYAELKLDYKVHLLDLNVSFAIKVGHTFKRYVL